MPNIGNPASTLVTVIETIIYVYTSEFLVRFTIFRLFMVFVLIPPYLLKTAIKIVLSLAKGWPELLFAKGRYRLFAMEEVYRTRAGVLAQRQLDGTYNFPEEVVLHVEQDGGWMDKLAWPPSQKTKEFTVCGLKVRYVEDYPTDRNTPPKRPILFLHGNPGWSYMWRHILPELANRGHPCYSIDWLGHGRSDKIRQKESISFELHMQTLMAFVDRFQLRDAIIVANDWGGCIALCTLPYLPSGTCSGLFLLNSFLPPRLSDLTLRDALLYIIWHLSIALFDGYLPEFSIMSFMCPHITQKDVEGYAAPYSCLPASAKCDISHLSHCAPLIPRFILHNLRETYLWKVIEGLCGPPKFSSMDAQARLSIRADGVRKFWQSRAGANHLQRREMVHGERFRLLLVFGENDPLLKDYKNGLVRSIGRHCTVGWAKDAMWLENAGHYLVEDKPAEVVDLVEKFAA